MTEQRTALIPSVGLALGTAQWGTDYGIANRTGKPALQEVERILTCAAKHGIVTLDTARAYGDSERTIGQMIGGASDWTVITKLDPAATTVVAAEKSLQTSRTLLRRTVLDGVLLHRPEQRAQDQGRIWNLLKCERNEGRIRIIGVSAIDPEDAWSALRDPSVDCMQVASSLFDQRLSRAGFFDEAQRTKKMVFVRSVYLQGVAHLDPDGLPQHLDLLRQPLHDVRAWAQRHGVAPASAFLAFAAGQPGARVLFGCETLSQLEQSLACWREGKAIDHTHVTKLAQAIPELPAHVLNPAMWPKTAA